MHPYGFDKFSHVYGDKQPVSKKKARQKIKKDLKYYQNKAILTNNNNRSSQNVLEK
jgi:hypothetical protein